MHSDLNSLKDGHPAQVVAIPYGLFRRESKAVYPVGRKAEAVDADPARFNVREIVKNSTRVARAATIDIGGLQRPHSSCIEDVAIPPYPTTERSERDESPSSRPPKKVPATTPYRHRRFRSSVSAAPLLPSLPEVNTRPVEQDRATPDDGTHQTHVFRALSSFNFGQRRQSSTQPPLLYSGGNGVDGGILLSIDPEVRRSRMVDRPIHSRSDDAGTRGAKASIGTRLANRASVVADHFPKALSRKRRTSMASIYEKAQVRQEQLKRSTWFQLLFEYSMYVLIVASVYFVLVGMPLWRGTVWYIYVLISKKFVFAGGTAVFVGLAAFFAFGPLVCCFEKTSPQPEPGVRSSGANATALVIPCYKSENLIAATLEGALKIFPPENIFVIANGNSPTPLDNTESVCTTYGVNHTWCPLGSKLIAQFVGARVCKRFPSVIFIDDDCLLPPNFPVVTDRLNARTKCIGYTIKSTGPNGSKGTLCQQAQDLEYKLSGIQRLFAGKIGSATFPHGAISLWDREFCIQTFKEHPGFSVSEDWFFGHVARELGSRIEMCTSVFVETETPAVIFWAGKGAARGGFGEMTVFKQRFKRWNFFFVNGIYYNMHYILFSWKLGWRELGAKLFVFQEIYETALYLTTPFVLPICFVVRPLFTLYLFVATAGMYFINALIFNEVHLRMRNERVTTMTLAYYMWFKFLLSFVNVGSCYWSIWKYANYFAKRHPKVLEDTKVVEVVLKIEDKEAEEEENDKARHGRRMTVTALGVNIGDVLSKHGAGEDEVAMKEGIKIQDFGL